MDFRSQDIAVHILADGCISRTQQDRILALQVNIGLKNIYRKYFFSLW